MEYKQDNTISLECYTRTANGLRDIIANGGVGELVYTFTDAINTYTHTPAVGLEYALTSLGDFVLTPTHVCTPRGSVDVITYNIPYNNKIYVLTLTVTSNIYTETTSIDTLYHLLELFPEFNFGGIDDLNKNLDGYFMVENIFHRSVGGVTISNNVVSQLYATVEPKSWGGSGSNSIETYTDESPESTSLRCTEFKHTASQLVELLESPVTGGVEHKISTPVGMEDKDIAGKLIDILKYLGSSELICKDCALIYPHGIRASYIVPHEGNDFVLTIEVGYGVWTIGQMSCDVNNSDTTDTHTDEVPESITVKGNVHPRTASQLVKLIESPVIGSVRVTTTTTHYNIGLFAQSKLLTILKSMDDAVIVIDDYYIILPHGLHISVKLPYKGEEFGFVIDISDSVCVGGRTLTEFKEKINDDVELDLSMLPDDITDDCNIYFLQYNAFHSLFIAHTIDDYGVIVNEGRVSHVKPVVY